MDSRTTSTTATILLVAVLVGAVADATPGKGTHRTREHDDALRAIHEQMVFAVSAAASTQHGAATVARMQLKHEALALARMQRRAGGGSDATTPLPSHLMDRLQPLPEPHTGIIDATTFADASGVQDAAPGLQQAIQVLLKGSGPRQALWANRTDLSGRRLELGGGQYLLNAPLFIPAGYGNFEIRGGTLRAGPNFPAEPSGNGTGPGAFLLTMGEASNATYSPGYVTSVSINSVLFQGSGLAHGGLHCVYCVGVNIGPAVFVEGFPGNGIQVDLGAEVLVHDCWFTGPYLSNQLWPQHKDPPPPELDHSIAVQINGNDHIVLNSVVWQYTTLGLQVNGAAALVQGIHAWGCGSVWCAGGPNALTGISVTTHQTRIVDCYLDFNFLDLYDPDQIVVVGTFFLGTTTRLRAKDLAHGHMQGLTMMANVNYNAVTMVGNFSSPTARAHIEDDNIPNVQHSEPAGTVKYAGRKLTYVRRSASSADALQGGALARFVFNMSDEGPNHNYDTLLLPSIDFMQYSVAFAEEETHVDTVHYTVLSRAGDVVTVVFDAPVLATVFVEARCCTGGMQQQLLGRNKISR